MVLVRWEDATVDTDYDGPAADAAGSTALLEDIGFLYSHTRRHLKLAMSRCSENQTIRWLNIIPTGLVRELITLGPTAPPEDPHA